MYYHTCMKLLWKKKLLFQISYRRYRKMLNFFWTRCLKKLCVEIILRCVAQIFFLLKFGIFIPIKMFPDTHTNSGLGQSRYYVRSHNRCLETGGDWFLSHLIELNFPYIREDFFLWAQTKLRSDTVKTWKSEVLLFKCIVLFLKCDSFFENVYSSIWSDLVWNSFFFIRAC